MYASVSRDISIYGTSFLFWSLSRDISIYGTSYGRFVQKVIVSCFSDSFCHILLQSKGASAEGSRRR